MAKRHHLVSALDLGHYSFDTFLGERLEGLKIDLLRECNRIAVARELALRNQLSESRKENEQLKEKLQAIPEVNVSTERDPAVQVLDIDAGNPNQVVTTLTSPELSLSALLNDDGVKSEHWKLWGEWQRCVGSDRIVEFYKEVDFSLSLGKFSRSPWMVGPQSKFAVSWELLGAPILLYDLVMIPMRIFHPFEGILFELFSWVVILYWTVDILLRFFVIGRFDNDAAVQLDRKVVMKTYLKTSFAFDFLMVAPDWASKAFGSAGLRSVAVLRFLRILRLMRLLRMSKVKRILRDIEDFADTEYITIVVSILVNLVAILAMCHYCGCFWFWVGTLKVQGYPSWVDEYAQDDPWEYQYVMCLHWAIAQFTPGASTLKAMNILESLASILVLILGLIFLSMFITSLAQARARLQAITSKLERDSWMLRRYLRQQRVPLDLQLRAIKYVEKCVEPTMSQLQRKDVTLLSLLSRPLQLEVEESQHFKTLHHHPFFQHLRSRSVGLTLQLFINVIIDIVLADLDTLFEDGSVSHEMYFVSRGAIGYHSVTGGAIDHVEYLRESDWCSEHVIWLPWVHTGTAKAAVASHVISIDSAKFRAAVLEHSQRFYVSRCAHGYLNDMNALLDKGELVTDMTQIKHDTSSYMMAVSQERSTVSFVDVSTL